MRFRFQIDAFAMKTLCVLVRTEGQNTSKCMRFQTKTPPCGQGLSLLEFFIWGNFPSYCSRAVTATKSSKECVARANLVYLLNLLLFWRSRCLLRFSLERYADYDLTYCLSIYSQSLSIKKTIKIYNSCLNTTAINNRGKDPLVKLIEKYGGWTVTNTKRSNVLLEELMGRVLRELNVQTLLKVVVVTDLYDSNKHILNVSTNKAYSVSLKIFE